MERQFTVDSARALLPALREQADVFVALRADLADLDAALRGGSPSPLGGRAERKALEARLADTISWFESQGVQVKGVAPLLLDFPAVLDGHDVLLCWLEGEAELRWYHRAELGFLGRRRLPG